jgi:hypothetical protein
VSKRAALVALTQNRGEIDAALLVRLLVASQSDSERVDRSFRRTHEQKLARPEVGAASGALATKA